MRLGYKSQMLIDILIASGLDLLDFATFPTRALFRGERDDGDKLLKQQLNRMRGDGWIEWGDPQESHSCVAKLTAIGRSEATDDIDPETEWGREWDGRWRLIIFDIPAEARLARRDLDLWLRKRRFGHLQGSVWIRPDFPDSWRDEIRDLRIEPARVSFFEEARSVATSSRDIVRNAWDFDAIRQKYTLHLKFLHENRHKDAEEWLATESKLWRAAFTSDPFLPDALLPQAYLGKEAWRCRRDAYRQLLQTPRPAG